MAPITPLTKEQLDRFNMSDNEIMKEYGFPHPDEPISIKDNIRHKISNLLADAGDKIISIKTSVVETIKDNLNTLMEILILLVCLLAITYCLKCLYRCTKRRKNRIFNPNNNEQTNELLLKTDTSKKH